MPPIVSIILRFAPFVALVGLNLWVLLFMHVTSQEDIWTGPPMPGKRLALADQAPSKEAEVVAVAPPPTEKPPAKPAKPEKPPVVSEPNDKGEFIVQAGGFLDLGTSVMLDRLRKGGFEPWVETTQEVVRLNDVQAGPYADQKEAKEAEAQLKAAGVTAKVQETWEGFIISLSQNFALGDAIEEMEKAQALGLGAVRLVKIEEERTVKRVCVGPFPSRTKAKEVSARVAKIGLTVPVIKEWFPPSKQPR